MKRLLLTSAAVVLAVSGGAYAETNSTHPTGSPSQVMAANNATAPAQAGATDTTASTGATNHRNVRDELSQNLEKAGFTDVRIIPDSFLVQAKDRSGNPVTMFINPDSMEILTSESGSGATNGRNAGPMNGQGGMFTNIPSSEDLTSKVVGLDVYNSQHQDIGKIKDVAFDGNRVRAYIVGVGGFLGMGDHYVAVMPSAINIRYDANNKTWHAAMNTTADQLKAAPEYKYASND